MTDTETAKPYEILVWDTGWKHILKHKSYWYHVCDAKTHLPICPPNEFPEWLRKCDLETINDLCTLVEVDDVCKKLGLCMPGHFEIVRNPKQQIAIISVYDPPTKEELEREDPLDWVNGGCYL